jgi:hypothetical protein
LIDAIQQPSQRIIERVLVVFIDRVGIVSIVVVAIVLRDRRSARRRSTSTQSSLLSGGLFYCSALFGLATHRFSSRLTHFALSRAVAAVGTKLLAIAEV